jgi:hypothetical protein
VRGFPEKRVAGFMKRRGRERGVRFICCFLLFVDYKEVIVLFEHYETGEVLWWAGKWSSADCAMDASGY